MEELIKAKCEEYDINPDVLTPEEKAQLQREIEAEQRGEPLRDSVLDDPDIRYRGW
jgi:hypothetical protein